MFGVVKNTTLMASVCFGMGWPATAQPASPQALVFELWTDFSQTCVPFLMNPENALSREPEGEFGFQQFSTADESVTYRHEGFIGDYDKVRSVEVHIGKKAGMIACEVYRTENLQPFPPQMLEDALGQMMAQLPGVSVTGGEMVLTSARGVRADQANFYNGEAGFRAYIVEGALPPRLDFIQVEIGDELFGLYVSATVAREDWQ